MPRTRVQMKKTTTLKVPEDKVLEMLFANQFMLAGPAKSYGGVKFAVQHDETHTTPQIGKHEFSIECSVTKKFLGLLEWYSGKDKIELQAVHVIETGLSNRDAKTHQFDPVDENMLRILINLREEDATTGRHDSAATHVGLGITISPKKDQKVTCWLDMQQSFATVLPGTLSNLSFISGNGDIPGKRRSNGKSVYVIMDIIPKQDTQYNTADEIAKHTHVKKSQFLEQLKKMHKDGKIPTAKFEELMKDPESAFRKMMQSEGEAAAMNEDKQAEEEMTEAANHNATHAIGENDDDFSMGAPSQSILHFDAHANSHQVSAEKEVATINAGKESVEV